MIGDSRSEPLSAVKFAASSEREVEVTDFTREIRRQLRQAGWQFHRQAKGDHEVWINPRTGEKVTVDGKVRNRALANKILKDASIGKKL